ncbi:hypothetical protein LZD49_30880 [Dyadobacter sp. CY261]|uniref:hypothetical protein n=1 Tax=Dyadobacter sp. CY261 TaxID=2907203 RepID=UPI001F31789D|nr:hypothetical protein [Dyadobacter sp. CY261]MCF0074930.1 hypothetical protein [Dyadobacter sp. CY261]
MKRTLVLLGLIAAPWLFSSCQKDSETEELFSKQSTKPKFSTAKFDNSTNIVAIDWSDVNQKFYYWSTQGFAIFGTYNDTDPVGSSAYAFTLAPGKIPSDIVETAIYAPVGGGVNKVFTYYYDGTVSSGISNDLDSYTAPTPYSCPTGYNPSNIVGMSITSQGNLFTWYNDGKVSVGNSTNHTNLYNVTAPTSYSLPPGKTYSQIIAMAFDRNNNNLVYTWFTDGTVSKGSSIDLDAIAAPVAFD